MDAIYNVLDVKSSFFIAVFPFNCVVISTNNKIRYENPASTGSLAGSKRFFLHSICLARTRTNEPAANLLHQSRHVEIDAASSRPGLRQKKFESVSKACRKHVANPHKPGRKPGLQPGLQLARIMKCGLYCLYCGWR